MFTFSKNTTLWKINEQIAKREKYSRKSLNKNEEEKEK
jgi:hypothetical protein